MLYVKFPTTTMIQGRKVFTAGTRVPEDNKLPMQWKRIVQNDLESMPMAFVEF
uniref:Uncharacterized protein n=1 Tax=Globisporangium ultimum (strain ATCC 200006 / CBS 805.95 / DAOM BR144) TaxID=431595 RepID=K3WC81_GLOUD